MERARETADARDDAARRHRELLARLAAAAPGSASSVAAGALAAFAEVEAELAGLRALLAGLGRLQAALDRAGALAAIEAVVRGVLGSDELVVYERSGGALVAARAHGVGEAAMKPVPLPGAGAATLAWVRERPGKPSDPPHTMSACVPLVAGGEVVGALVVYRLADGRAAFRPCDRALLDTLGAQAGAALRRAALEAQVATTRR